MIKNCSESLKESGVALGGCLLEKSNQKNQYEDKIEELEYVLGVNKIFLNNCGCTDLNRDKVEEELINFYKNFDWRNIDWQEIDINSIQAET